MTPVQKSEHKSWQFEYTSWAKWSILPHRTTPNLFILMDYYSLNGYLSPSTRVPHYRVTVLATVPQTCIIHENSILIWFEFKTANQPGFEPGSCYPKHWATLHWLRDFFNLILYPRPLLPLYVGGLMCITYLLTPPVDMVVHHCSIIHSCMHGWLCLCNVIRL